MFDLGFAELVTFGMIALIVLGPEKLPRAMRTLGTYYAKFRRTISTIQAEMESELDLAETRQKMQEELAKIKQAELDMQNQMAQMRQNMRQFEQNQNKQMAGTNFKNSIKENSTLENSNLQTNHNDNDLAIPEDQNIYEQDIDRAKSKSGDRKLDNNQNFANTRPWENMWFRLGSYDKAKRLPDAPFLPNYSADELLNTSSLTNDNASDC